METHYYDFRLPKEVDIKLMGATCTLPTAYTLPILEKLGKVLWWDDTSPYFCKIGIEIKNVNLTTMKKLVTISRILHCALSFDRVIKEGEHVITERDGQITAKGISVHMKNVHPSRRTVGSPLQNPNFDPQVLTYDAKTHKMTTYRTPKEVKREYDGKQNAWLTTLFKPFRRSTAS